MLHSEKVVTCMWTRSSGSCSLKQEAVPHFVHSDSIGSTAKQLAASYIHDITGHESPEGGLWVF
jgi:hypothetical protein